MNKPKIETMLPSEAKKALEDYFYAQMLERLKKRGELAGYNRITQQRDHLDLINEFDYREYGTWINEIKHACFDAAEKRIEQDYPLCWSNEYQIAYRKGDGKLYFRKHDKEVNKEKVAAIKKELKNQK